MNNSKYKYIGLDVHQATTSIAVLDGKGTLLMDVTIATQASPLLEFLGGLQGTLYLTFEEGTQAAWLYDLLSPRVEKVVVCDPRYNSLLKSGNKNDRTDARKLADLLRTGMLKPVYHAAGSGGRRLQELSRSYFTLVQDTTRVMNRLKAIFRSRGIACRGSRVYSTAARIHWLQQLREPGARQRATLLYQQLDVLQALRREARRALLAASRKHPAHRVLLSVPGLGPIRVALLLARMQTPYRFRTKRHLWAYAGLGLVTRTSADYRIVHGGLERSRKPVAVRGLNQNHNHDLKEVFKSAALRASRLPGPWREFFTARVAQGMKPELARLTLARKLAAITLTLWKKGEPYDDQKLIAQAA
jgi:transposase